MNTDRLNTLLSRFPSLTILVVGDFFLDKYLIIEHALGEISLETGLEAHQVVGVRCQPGAAGTVTNNLRAMGVNVLAAGIVGDDGEGFELLRVLDMTGVNVDALVIRSDRFTPTYTKPMLREPDGSAHELNRLDIKTGRRWLPTPRISSSPICAACSRVSTASSSPTRCRRRTAASSPNGCGTSHPCWPRPIRPWPSWPTPACASACSRTSSSSRTRARRQAPLTRTS